jgi:DNA-binding MurR/RpiR family transcriptional regulator
MTLSDIAEGVSVTTRQRERGVASVDRTDASLADRLAEYADDLPTDAETAAALAEAYASGGSVGDAGDEAGVPPTTAAKALHRLGFEGLTPFSPLQRDVLDDWLDARVSRADAVELTGASDREFALAAYVATHDRLPGAAEAVESALSSDGDAMVEKRAALDATLPEPGSG